MYAGKATFTQAIFVMLTTAQQLYVFYPSQKEATENSKKD